MQICMMWWKRGVNREANQQFKKTRIQVVDSGLSSTRLTQHCGDTFADGRKIGATPHIIDYLFDMPTDILINIFWSISIYSDQYIPNQTILLFLVLSSSLGIIVPASHLWESFRASSCDTFVFLHLSTACIERFSPQNTTAETTL